jgi:hypothetical protein
LQLKRRVDDAIESIRPEHRLIRKVHQVRSDAQLLARAAHRAVEDVSRAEVLRNSCDDLLCDGRIDLASNPAYIIALLGLTSCGLRPSNAEQRSLGFAARHTVSQLPCI